MPHLTGHIREDESDRTTQTGLITAPTQAVAAV
jgi:hypothetical protein